MTDSGEQHTFLFADLAGFTALTEAHGDRQAADLAVDFFGSVRPLLALHGAEEIKTIGDAVMIRGDEPAAAIELGLRIVEEVTARPRFPTVRVGMHTGSAIERAGDWFGGAVNLAARVAGVAAGREVLLTATTRAAAGELSGIALRRRGEQRFKNVIKPVQVYQAQRDLDEPPRTPIDPVCRMAIDPSHAVGALSYQGREYVFCSLTCAQAFAATPEAFTRSLGGVPGTRRPR